MSSEITMPKWRSVKAEVNWDQENNTTISMLKMGRLTDTRHTVYELYIYRHRYKKNGWEYATRLRQEIHLLVLKDFSKG